MTAFIEEAQRFLRLAERDFRAFEILGAHAEIDLAVAGFHAQQAVEKSLKAVLTREGAGVVARQSLDWATGQVG